MASPCSAPASGLAADRQVWQARSMRQVILALLLTLAATSVVHADGEIDKRLTPFDKDRLARFDATLAEALAKRARAAAGRTWRCWSRFLRERPCRWRRASIRWVTGNAAPSRQAAACRWWSMAGSSAGSRTMVLAGCSKNSQAPNARLDGFTRCPITRLAYLGAGYVAGDKPRSIRGGRPGKPGGNRGAPREGPDHPPVPRAPVSSRNWTFWCWSAEQATA